VINADGMLGLFMCFVIALSSSVPARR